ncbi:MAG: murein L,D-transpeptidase catalytic domain family protein [Calothrix sp. SM1_5_4]|nr:murein L,D-transpeptidase catalytic domain family protein [Calothrix sp. SM1_5_4]
MNYVSWTRACHVILSGGLIGISGLLVACTPANSLQAQDEAGQEGLEAEVVPELSEREKAELAEFREDALTASQEATMLARYDYVDPDNEVPDSLLKKALTYYEANRSRIPNGGYLSIIDFAKASSRRRFFVIDMKTGAVLKFHVAHGSGSDRDHDGLAERFSNVSGSNASSLGYYKTAETYQGKHGLSLRLDGLSSTNSNARSRAIVIHGANYVSDANVKQGRSWGCPALSMDNRSRVINMLKGGSIIYAGLSG